MSQVLTETQIYTQQLEKLKQTAKEKGCKCGSHDVLYVAEFFKYNGYRTTKVPASILCFNCGTSTLASKEA
jgi:hypothetical protein